MSEYLVTWECNIEAETPLSAAHKAELIQYEQTVKKYETLGGVFKISGKDLKEPVYIDLEEYYYKLRKDEP